MYRRAAMTLMLLASCSGYLGLASVSEAARPGPLTCHKVECPMPGPCQVRTSERCDHGGGPPRCPAVINGPDDVSCDDGNTCTTDDVCTTGVSGGAPLVCTSTTDTCEPSSGCATNCGIDGCVVSAGGAGDPTLTIPAGALSEPLRISMVDLGPNPDPSDPSVFRVYDLGPDGTMFATPATLDLPAPPLAPGEIAVIELNDGTGWAEIPTTLNAGRVTGPISHFSQCRTRATAPTSSGDLSMVDMVEYQDVVNILNPNGLMFPDCDPGTSLHGVCFRFRNTSMFTVVSASAHVFLWQCYTVLRNYTNPVTGEYEGEHCDITGLVIPCADFEVPLTLPPGGLGPGKENTGQYTISPDPVCFGSSFIGVDVTFREPTVTDPAAGIRSAKDGPFVSGSIFQGIYPQPKVNNSGTIIKNFMIDARE